MANKDHLPCAKCGRLTHIDDLDAKPGPGAMPDPADSPADWNRLECGECYGPGYVSNRTGA